MASRASRAHRLGNTLLALVVGGTNLGCSLDLPDPPRSCRELLATGLSDDGIYQIHGKEGLVEVYCAMSEASGGWTLIGRSAPSGGDGVFGWRGRAGDLRDDGRAYSLAAFDHLPSDIGELLVVGHDGSKAFAQTGYRIVLPPDFLARCSDRACEALAVERVWGQECTGQEIIAFDYIGHTDQDNQFYFHSTADFDSWMGLRRIELDLGGSPSCLNHTHAMLFAR